MLCPIHIELIIWESMSFTFGQTYYLLFSLIVYGCIYQQFIRKKSTSTWIHFLSQVKKEDMVGFPTWDFHNQKLFIRIQSDLSQDLVVTLVSYY